MAATAAWADNPCVTCHTVETPNIGAEITCDVCHGDGHTSAADVDKVETITADTCGICHDTQFDQFSKGKHALAWVSYEAMPTTHALPMAMTGGYALRGASWRCACRCPRTSSGKPIRSQSCKHSTWSRRPTWRV